MKITISDVAAAAKVSPSTVSRVLTNRSGFMTEDTRRRVLATIQKLGYVPNAHASSLRSRRSTTIGVIVTNIMNPFFTAVIRGIQDFVAPKGYELFICNTDDQAESESHYLSALLSRNVDGLIVTTCHADGRLYKPLIEKGYPLVLVDRGVASLRSDTVVVDNVGITRDVVSKLTQMGHNRIGFITPSLGSIQPRLDRIEGSRMALRERNLTLDPALLIETASDIESGSEAAARLLLLASPPTALFVLNTFQAIGALQRLQELGTTIPDQLSFVMFDDQKWAELIRPRISTVIQPAYEIGHRAGSLVIERIANTGKTIETVLLKAEYIERESVGASPVVVRTGRELH